MKHLLIALASLLFTFNVQASPGAHGPNGEHLDGPSSANTTIEATPRFEAFTETFELVGKLYETELSVLVEEYKTNIPVLKADIELEVNGVKAKATFHSDANDYAFDDARLLEQLRKPGEHELIFTITTQSDSDLVLGTLTTDRTIGTHSHGHTGHSEHEHADDGDVQTLLRSPMSWVTATILALIASLLIVRRRMMGKN